MGGGQRRSRHLAHFAGGPGRSRGGGSSACFARIARLALVRVGEVLGVVCWRGNRRQRWSWRCGGHFSRVVFMRRRRWRIGGGRGVVTVLAPARWC